MINVQNVDFVDSEGGYNVGVFNLTKKLSLRIDKINCDKGYKVAIYNEFELCTISSRKLQEVQSFLKKHGSTNYEREVNNFVLCSSENQSIISMTMERKLIASTNEFNGSLVLIKIFVNFVQLSICLIILIKHYDDFREIKISKDYESVFIRIFVSIFLNSNIFYIMSEGNKNVLSDFVTNYAEFIIPTLTIPEEFAIFECIIIPMFPIFVLLYLIVQLIYKLLRMVFDLLNSVDKTVEMILIVLLYLDTIIITKSQSVSFDILINFLVLIFISDLDEVVAGTLKFEEKILNISVSCEEYSNLQKVKCGYLVIYIILCILVSYILFF